MNIKELTQKENYSFDDLCQIMELLRGENGCQWDREQTHKSIRKNFIEETYEAIEAIDTSDYTLMCEELGDVLLQVVFHSQIAKESGNFDINNVINGICKKLIVRHPHVFADTVVNNSQEVLVNWEKIKKQEKNSSQEEILQNIPKCLPALVRCQKILDKKGEKVDYKTALSNLQATTKSIQTKSDIGRLLKQAVVISKSLKIDAEEALYEEINS